MTLLPYLKISGKEFPGNRASRAPGAKYWSPLKNTQTLDTHGPVYGVAFNPADGSELSVCSGSDILLLDSSPLAPKKRLSRGGGGVLSLSYRSDGRLLAAGSDTGLIQVYDVSSGSAVRTLNKHTKAAHSVLFDAKTRVVSASDDMSVKLWDFVSENPVATFEGHHTDYIRSIGIVSPDLIVSGSYDSTCALWDVRAPLKPVSTYRHSGPVEGIAVNLSRGTFYSCGGLEIREWDPTCEKPLFSISPHQKTITSLFYDSKSDCLLSGSLDHHLTVTKLADTPSLEYSFVYPSQILSLDMSTDFSRLAVGLSNSSVVLKSRQTKAKSAPVQEAKPPESSELIVYSARPTLFKFCDRYLKSFQYKKAFDVTFETRNRGMILAVLEELYHRNALRSALSDKDPQMVKQICSFVLRAMTNHLVAPLLCVVCLHLIEIYGQSVGASGALDDTFKNMKDRISAELSVQRELTVLSGALEMIVSSCDVNQ